MARNVKDPRNPKKYQAVPRNPRKNPRKIEIVEISLTVIKQNKLLPVSSRW